MKETNQLYIESLLGESVRGFHRRYFDKTGATPDCKTMRRCWADRPIVKCNITKWVQMHAWLPGNIDEEDYIWYGHVFFFTNDDQAALFRLMFG